MCEGFSVMSKVPHPIPYQGSKRNLAGKILDLFPKRVETLIEPFAGSAAVTLAAAQEQLGRRYLLGDSLAPLASLWTSILNSPGKVADGYESLWNDQQGRQREFYDEVRADFNRDGDPVKLLYLLARCVKNAVRFNPRGEFNQSPDNRRLGMRPEKLRQEVMGAASLLAGRTEVMAGDYEQLLLRAGPHDLVYMDPPYQGTSEGRDRRYRDQLDRGRFVEALASLNARGISYIVSFDGRCGEKAYGEPLPKHLGLHHLEVHAGVSSQATLSGRSENTVESLYLSPTFKAADRSRELDRPVPAATDHQNG